MKNSQTYILVPVSCAFLMLASSALHIGCSSDSSDDERDAGEDGGLPIPPPPEAGPGVDSNPPPPCDISKPFGAPVLVAGLESNIDIARLTDDELTIYYNSFADTNHRDLLTAKRTDRTKPFGTAKPLTQLNSASNEAAATITGDDRNILFTSNRAGGGWQIFWSQRSDPTLDFASPTQVTGFSAPGNLTDPAAFAGANGGIELWFRADGSGNGDLYVSTVTNGVASTAVAQTPLNSDSANDLLPALSPDRLVVFFASDRQGDGAKGGYDIWTAKRPTPIDAFASVSNVAELNGTSSEWPTWLSVDGCRLYLTSDRNAVQSTYVADRPK